MSNAVTFTPAGGRIDANVTMEQSRLTVRVTDSGIGIPREFLPHVFERFTQLEAAASRAYGGLGLGLAICRHLVELHGGSIEHESAGQDQGATFTVTLPVRALLRRCRPISAGKTTAIALTAYARNEDRVRALTSGCDQHIAKPVTPVELLARGNALLAGKTCPAAD